MRGRTLVAGVGNVLLGDDGFGPAVIAELLAADLPDEVVVTDYGIGGIHLAYDVLDGWDALVVVDALGHGREPGTVSVVDLRSIATPGAQLDAHSMDPAAVLGALGALGGELPAQAVLVGCEPADTAERLGLSDPVRAAVGPAVTAVRDLVQTSHTPSTAGKGG